MRCDAVRERLPDYPDGELHPVGPIEVHLASCGACRAELGEYRRLRELLAEMATTPEPSEELLPEVLRSLPFEPLTSRPAAGARTRYALASLGGAAVGATAIAIVWWRATRRPQHEQANAAV